MSIFDVSSDIKQEDEKDVIGGFKLFDTGIYAATIQVAYLDKYASGAHNATVVFKLADGSKYSEVMTLSNKAGDNFYVDKKTGDKRLLPAFNALNNACLLITGKALKDTTLEEKLVKVYDRDAKEEVAKPRQVMMDLVGAKVNLGIYKIAENKQVRTENDGKVKYVDDPTGAIREKNEIKKWFDSELRTQPEQKADKPAAFYKEWEKAHTGKVKDNVKKVANPVGTTTASAEDLFKEDD